ncbi:MAG: hypothetical protein IPH43_15075 [Xanthomonadales bacterium]|nr:hypothetical protein [Xanthomonadales bacterium]
MPSTPQDNEARGGGRAFSGLVREQRRSEKSDRRVPENINGYLVDSPDVALQNRREAICVVPPIVFGSMPNDGGNLLLTDDEMKTLLDADAPWPVLGAKIHQRGIVGLG